MGASSLGSENPATSAKWCLYEEDVGPFKPKEKDRVSTVGKSGGPSGFRRGFLLRPDASGLGVGVVMLAPKKG